jgi:hypothetical protein
MLKVNNLTGLGVLFQEVESPPGEGIVVLGSSTAAGFSGTSISHSFDCPATTDFLIACLTCFGISSPNFSSVAWNSVAMTEAVTALATSFSFLGTRASIFYLTAPSTGTFNLTASVGNSIGAVQLIACKNVLQSSSLDVTGTAITNDSGTVSKTVNTTTTVANAIRVGTRVLNFGSNVSSSYTPGTGVTETGDIATDGSNNGRFFAGHHISSSTGLFSFECSGTNGTSAIGDAMAVAAFKGV